MVAPLEQPPSKSFLATVTKMGDYVLSCTAELLERGDITEDDAANANSKTTPERIIECLVDCFVMDDFLSEGIGGQYCRQIVHAGPRIRRL